GQPSRTPRSNILGPQRAPAVGRTAGDGLVDGLVDVLGERVDELVGHALLPGADHLADLALHDEEPGFLLLALARLGHPAPPSPRVPCASSRADPRFQSRRPAPVDGQLDPPARNSTAPARSAGTGARSESSWPSGWRRRKASAWRRGRETSSRRPSGR